ncbi:glycoside hydrolase [Streptomyces sp. MNP-20]|uniref:glycoside hydrolase n=1 Tax=Streptomyces sp. MNP-20 TaxID=2721165 RepID=UPI0015539A5C|nr:glycoside hydrolase [Streptomyces sp. MNP-20]
MPLKTTTALGLVLALAAGAAPAAAAPDRAPGAGVELAVRGGTAVVDTATLAVRARTRDGHDRLLSAASATPLGAPGPVHRLDGGRVRWSYPERGLDVTARSDHGRLALSFAARRDTTLRWPVTGVGAPAAASLQLPRGEGLDIPVADPFWTTGGGRLAGTSVDVGADLTLPLWGYSAGRHGVSYLTPTDIGTSLAFTEAHGRLRATAAHAFRRAEGTRAYTVTLALTDGSPVAPAADYRAYLAERGRLGSLRAKFRQNPAARKLLGAFHAYLWGEARTAAGVRRLRALGADRMWLGYDAGPGPMDKKAVAAAQAAGYLVGPYDTFANGQDPKAADSPTSVWPGRVYPDFCVRNADGTPHTGFGGRGCYLSSAAFERAEPARHYLADRTRAMVRNGADSYFLDVDATGELFRDHSAAHPMTKAQDRAHRLARMRRIAGSGLVLGSETAQAWANQAVAFDHGSATPVADGLWTLQKDREKWGGYYPENAPKAFFKPVRLPAGLSRAMYAPRYRVPLYGTALHGSTVSAERWELSYEKLPAEKTRRALLAMLYDRPLNYVLDGPALARHGRELAALQRYFAPLHRAAGAERLTSFRWLTGDRSVQRTVFGDGTLTVTANFGTKTRAGLPGGCADAKLRTDARPRRLCPADAGS